MLGHVFRSSFVCAVCALRTATPFSRIARAAREWLNANVLPEKSKGVDNGMVLLALGIVFGDIGTSPLYAFGAALSATGKGAAGALGVASLIVWTLFLVVTIKYVLLVMRAEYQGEGGIFALSALLRDAGMFKEKRWQILTGLLIFGAALLFGDGAITPAISVLSAVEGLAAVHPSLAHLSLPATTFILTILFIAQRYGTGRLGGIFGPIMLLWFGSLAAMGAIQICHTPQVLNALNPIPGLMLLGQGGWKAWAIIGAVVLAVTGAEALYADLGHFGRAPILRAWSWIVFPALILNYLGQAALVMRSPSAAANPNLFFLLAPCGWLRATLVVLATGATVIASQALISGVFSLSSQAMDLGFLPRFFVRHTSKTTRGQIYIPLVNTLLGLACLMLVFNFRTSAALANAYGIAVTGAMAITSVAFAAVVWVCWKRPPWQCGLLLAGLLCLDLPLFGACMTKLFEGGFVPVLVAAAVGIVMLTWRKGRTKVRQSMSFGSIPVAELGARLANEPFRRSEGTEVSIVRRPNPEHAVARILEQYRRVKILGSRLVILLLEPSWKNPMEKVQEITIQEFPGGLWQVQAVHGYMVEPDVPLIMQRASEQTDRRLAYDPNDTFFVVAREIVISSPENEMRSWQRHLFAFMSRNVVPGPNYLCIPADRLIIYNWLLRL